MKRALLMSVTMLAMSLVLAVGATLALFSDSALFEAHLKAGSLNVTLTRTHLVSTTLDDNGYLVTKEDAGDVDFTDANNKNIFNLAQDAVIVPGSKFTVDLKIANQSSVASNYYIEIVYKSGGQELSNQIKVTVDAGTPKSAFVKDGVTIGSASQPIGTIVKNGTKNFKVSVEFVNSNDNNSAQGQNVQFDLIVHAVQATTAP